MKPLNKYIILDEIKEDIKETTGGLLLAEKHRDDIRYRKGKLVALGNLVEPSLKIGDVVWFDKGAGHNIEYTDGSIRKVITEANIVIVE